MTKLGRKVDWYKRLEMASRFPALGLRTPTQRLNYFIDQLSTVILTHPSARPEVLDQLNRLVTRVSRERPLIANARLPGEHLKGLSVLNVVAEELGCILERLLPVDDQTGWQFWNGDALLPLSEKLIDMPMCRAVHRCLKLHVEELHTYIEGGELPSPELISLGDSLHAVMETLEKLEYVWKKLPIRWCRACFRRAPATSAYCNLHRLGQKENGTDTMYRKARRIFRKMDELDAEAWTKFRALYILPKVFGEPPEGSCELVAVMQQMETAYKWPDESKIWDEALRKHCPAFAKIVDRTVSDFENWESFARHVVYVLDNKLETDLSRANLYVMISEAEQYFSLEKQHRDDRITETGDAIVALRNAGARQVDIAKELGVSKQYVSRVLKSES